MSCTLDPLRAQLEPSLQWGWTWGWELSPGVAVGGGHCHGEGGVDSLPGLQEQLGTVGVDLELVGSSVQRPQLRLIAPAL